MYFLRRLWILNIVTNNFVFLDLNIRVKENTSNVFLRTEKNYRSMSNATHGAETQSMTSLVEKKLTRHLKPKCSGKNQRESWTSTFISMTVRLWHDEGLSYSTYRSFQEKMDIQRDAVTITRWMAKNVFVSCIPTYYS